MLNYSLHADCNYKNISYSSNKVHHRLFLWRFGTNFRKHELIHFKIPIQSSKPIGTCQTFCLLKNKWEFNFREHSFNVTYQTHPVGAQEYCKHLPYISKTYRSLFLRDNDVIMDRSSAILFIFFLHFIHQLDLCGFVSNSIFSWTCHKFAWRDLNGFG